MSEYDYTPPTSGVESPLPEIGIYSEVDKKELYKIEGISIDYLRNANPIDSLIKPDPSTKETIRRWYYERFSFEKKYKVYDVPRPYCWEPHWHAVCLVISLIGNGVYYGSGFLVGRRTILTAGHNIYFPGLGLASKIRVICGPVLGSDNRIYSHFPETEVANSQTAPEWLAAQTQWERPEYDYGAIFLKTDDLWSALAGWTWECNAVSQSDWDAPNLGDINIAGFPEVDVRGPLIHNYSGGRNSTRPAGLVSYYIPTKKGLSGGPIYHYKKLPNGKILIYAMGLHKRGYGSNGGQGVRFDDNNMHIINKWKNLGAPILMS